MSRREGAPSRGRGIIQAETREILATFFNASPADHFVFTQNATDSLNMAIHGFLHHLGGTFHVLTTELEHNAVLRPLRTLEQEGRISLSIIPFDERGYISLDTIKNAIRDDTRLTVMTHGSNVIGTIQDISRIGEYLRANGIFFIVDGAQTTGQIPVDLGEMPCDVFAFTGHKALFGIPGIGGFFIRDPSQVDPVRQGGTGANSGYPLPGGGDALPFRGGYPQLSGHRLTQRRDPVP